jgi:uncharacterized protein
VKFGSGFFEEDDEIQVIPEGETHFDVSPFIYEYIHLLLPIRKVHPEDENGESRCNGEVVGRLDAPLADPEPDPRWEALKKLRNAR